MNATDISFPNIGIYLKNVPRSFSVFGFEIMLYAVCVVLGMFAGGMLAARIAKKEGWNPEIIWDFFFYGVFFGVLGARIYYVVFSWDSYKNDLKQIFNIRQGGLAIYGGVIAAFTTVFVYCKIKKLNGLRLLDTCVPGLILGQAIGRWGNFFNREVFGEYTNNLLAMRLPIDAVRSRDITPELAKNIGFGENFVQVHPTFLYESLWNIAVVVLLVKLGRFRKFYGEIGLWYLIGYGVGRFWIEGIRTDTLLIPGTSLAVSQVLAAVMVVGSIAIDLFVRYQIKNGKFKSIVFCPTSSH